MEVVYSEESQKDIQFWKRSGNKPIQNKIQQLINAIGQDPFNGIGKPEMLKHNLTGLWSRRINQEHRIVYEVLEEEDCIKIHSMKDHY
ncbi:Txe/YoeB family addiction module toxin [Mucilaginibacter sp. SJ]|uniref:Txe/YoeB family addiction module toxin n=1 Tax=Mucilaginibacter sp. SJ TaxID=3029053 RepID=UPI0023A9C30B|nr:Txe/YoeB family addiction module toxin [Mucilaginibacter sp. SJ]WDZ99124.1 Txe/YoeB family addiction module toxin [Mucilaginibacter sp. SJ]